MTQLTIEDIETLVESTDVECKGAQGRDGKGEVPKCVWESYCAMANTSGGHIYLGIEETAEHSFVVKGIKDIQKVQKNFWDTINEKSKVNRNTLGVADVEVNKIDKLNILHIYVPRARRNERPIHLGATPFGNTFVRRHEGDYKADDETVRRMIAEAVEDSRDDRILENFSIDDLEKDTVNAYRNRFSALKPDHPWISHSIDDFLKCIGATGVDRSTGKSGLRIAGLLMFGRYETIKEIFPYYMIDYQERPEPKTEARWIDRIVPDGTWSGNLYDFYLKSIRKLTADLKIPFKLQSETRIDDTPVHQALREALTNTLIHADYTGRVSILVVKRPDLFGFRNPGLMRVSVEQAMSGGISDCRNHRIQDLFRFIGLGEHAGSGIPGILKSWTSQHWRTPLLYEDRIYDQTLLELRTSSLLPPESVEKLQKTFGDKFPELTELQRIILVTAEAEGFVSHTRIKSLSTEHPTDISAALANLVRENFLEKEGATRNATYHLPGVRPNLLFSNDMPFGSPSSPDLKGNSPDLGGNSPDLGSNSPDLGGNSPDLKSVLTHILNEFGYKEMPGRIDSDKMRQLITELCKERWVTLKELGQLLNREPKALQDQYLTQMLADGSLKLKYPDTKNHPDQAYGVA
jgi:ATP-dependent DNA helicase RecG